MKISHLVVLVAILLVAATDSASAQKRYTFKRGELVQVSGKSCGVIGGKWTPVKKSGRSYVVDISNKTRCSRLLSPTSLRRGGLGKLPSAATLVRSRSRSGRVADPSGTPPILKNIPTISGGIKNLFWNAGVIDDLKGGSPSTQSCSEFFVGPTDGTSAGLIGCFSIQGVGFAFQSILEGAGGTCYMRNVPKQRFVDSGAITVIDGELPDGDITKVFSVPSGNRDRLVKVVISGFGGPGAQVGHLRIDSATKLSNAGRQYAYSSWFCPEGGTTAESAERVTVSLSGQYGFTGLHKEDSTLFESKISAALASQGSAVAFDPSQVRTSTNQATFSGGRSFKASVTITPQNRILTKVFDIFAVGMPHKNYSVGEFTGSSLADFRVLQSALKDRFVVGDMAGVFEYRGSSTSRYVSAPDGDLADEVNAVNFDTDPFYVEPASVDDDMSDYDCSVTADVTLQMDFSDPALRSVASLCERERLSGMDFCSSDPDVSAALAQVITSCGIPG